MSTKHKISNWYIAITVLISLSAISAFSQSQSIVRGRVTDEKTGEPIPGAIVKYRYANQENYMMGVATNSKGRYELSAPTGMIVHLHIEAESYATVVREALASRPMPSEVKIKLTKRSDYEAEWRRKNKNIQKDFKIYHRDPIEIFQLLDGTVEAKASVSTKLRTISVYGPQEQLEKIEEMIQKFDVPLKQIWLEVVLIQATGNGSSKPEYPKEIESVVKKLRSLFKFGKYAIIGRADAMGLEGATLRFSTGTGKRPEPAHFNVQTELGYAGDIISLDGLSIEVQAPQRSDLSTSVNVKNGETLILGASRGDAQKGSLITVVTARVVE